MIPLIEKEISDRRHWIPHDEFLDLLTLAQASPGPISLNAAVFVGYKMKGYVGAVIALAGLILPPFCLLLCVAAFFPRIQHNRWVEAAFTAMRPAVVALMLWPVITWLRQLDARLWPVVAVVAFAVWYFHLSPVWFLVAAVATALGWTHYAMKKGRER